MSLALTPIFIRQRPFRPRASAYTRPDQLAPYEPTPREAQILTAIYQYDGILADYQIQRLFFGSKVRMYARMHKLFQTGFVARPNRRERAQLEYTVYWLDDRGAAYLAALEKLPFKQFKWRKPRERWSQTTHDIATNDIHLAFVAACRKMLQVKMIEWIGESVFRRQTDRVTYTAATGQEKSRAIRFDGFCQLAVARPTATNPSNQTRLRFPIELDRANHDLGSFVEEKVRPWVAYIKSPAYKARFGANYGRPLVVTTSDLRLSYLKRKVEAAAVSGGNLFLFTTMEHIKKANILTAPVWQQPRKAQAISLIKPLP